MHTFNILLAGNSPAREPAHVTLWLKKKTHKYLSTIALAKKEIKKKRERLSWSFLLSVFFSSISPSVFFLCPYFLCLPVVLWRAGSWVPAARRACRRTSLSFAVSLSLLHLSARRLLPCWFLGGGGSACLPARLAVVCGLRGIPCRTNRAAMFHRFSFGVATTRRACCRCRVPASFGF